MHQLVISASSQEQLQSLVSASPNKQGFSNEPGPFNVTGAPANPPSTAYLPAPPNSHPYPYALQGTPFVKTIGTTFIPFDDTEERLEEWFRNTESVWFDCVTMQLNELETI